MEQINTENVMENKRIYSGITHSPFNDNNYKVLLNFSSLIEKKNEEILTVMSSKNSKSKHKSLKSTTEPSKY